MDSAFYMGLYLAVLDRRDLSLVHTGIYNTSSIIEGHYVDPITEKDLILPTSHDGFRTIDDFGVSNAMAKKIR